MLYSESTIFDDQLIIFTMLSLICRAIAGMPSGPEEEDSFDVDRASHGSEVVMGPVTFEASKSGENVMTSSSSLISVGGGGLLRTLA